MDSALALRESVKCPKCGTDAMVTGWTVSQVRTQSYMRFGTRGAGFIAGTISDAEFATCMCCGAKLRKSPAEMMRAA